MFAAFLIRVSIAVNSEMGGNWARERGREITVRNVKIERGREITMRNVKIEKGREIEKDYNMTIGKG